MTQNYAFPELNPFSQLKVLKLFNIFLYGIVAFQLF
jgi:hypothetical protein